LSQITTTDLYESAYYLISGCELSAIEGMQVDGKITCQMIFSGPNVGKLQAEYFQGEAVVKLFDFRRSYAHLNKLIYDSKKKFQKELREGGLA